MGGAPRPTRLRLSSLGEDLMTLEEIERKIAVSRNNEVCVERACVVQYPGIVREVRSRFWGASERPDPTQSSASGGSAASVAQWPSEWPTRWPPALDLLFVEPKPQH